LVAVFGAALAVAGFAAAALDSTDFDSTALAEVFAVLLGIELLLFLEDFAAAGLAAAAFAAVRVALAGGRTRPLVALRLAAGAFFAALEILFLRVFCDTA
jgi:hypothetical protein